jgi:hypothetical protein
MPVVNETKSNDESDIMYSVFKANQNKFINFEGDVANNITTPNVNSDWKSLLPIIGITSLVTASLVIILKGTR